MEKQDLWILKLLTQSGLDVNELLQDLHHAIDTM